MTQPFPFLRTASIQGKLAKALQNVAQESPPNVSEILEALEGLNQRVGTFDEFDGFINITTFEDLKKEILGAIDDKDVRLIVTGYLSKLR